MSAGVMAGTSPIVRGVRMMVAPVDQASGQPVVFDPAVQGRFQGVPAGWFDLGTVRGLEREASTVFAEVWSGAPAMVKTQARSRISAGLRCTLGGWSRLAIALSGGSQMLNLLRAAAGGASEQTLPLLPGSTATVLQVALGSSIGVGDIVVVDDDYTGQTGYLGAAIAGAHVVLPGALASDANYIRRVSFNVARVQQVSQSPSAMSLTLSSPLIAGVPAATMKLAVVQGFADRTGGTFTQVWSALLVMDGMQGDRVLVHYPRLQVAASAGETIGDLAPGLQRLRLDLHMNAMPVTDSIDGEAVLCYRSYLPAPGRLV